MTRLNQASGGLKTHEGGNACTISPYLQLRRSVMSCMLFEKEFYESGEEIGSRIAKLVPLVDPEKCVQLAIDARERANLRHAPLLIVREMARYPKHKKYVAKTLSRIITRADQITDFLALYWSTQEDKKTLSYQVKKGLAFAFHKFNEYQFAKYDRDNQVKLRDALFLSHSKPKDLNKDSPKFTKEERRIPDFEKIFTKNEMLYQQIVDRSLTTPDTWEVALSAGKDKREVFRRLMLEHKLGTLAFVRNLKNMIEADVSLSELMFYSTLCKVDKMLPYQFIAAAKAVPQCEPMLEIMMARCVEKMPKLQGKIALLIDVSGSMDDRLTHKSDMTRLDAACAVAILLRELTVEVPFICTFSSGFVSVPPRKGFALRDAIVNSQSHEGTELKKAIDHLNKIVIGAGGVMYDTLIVITDEQSHDGIASVLQGTKGYIINVASARNGVGYGQFTHIDGFSSSIVEWLINEQNEYTKYHSITGRGIQIGSIVINDIHKGG
jgi:60 kDa SS-A/Ro ribonucleoprotein